MDWLAWQKFFADTRYIIPPIGDPVRDVLDALDHYAPYFAQWSEWRTRPLCRFPLDYSAGYAMTIPHIGAVQEAAQLFALRMRAHLALGDSAAALADFREGFQAFRMLDDEPLMLASVAQLNTLTLLLNAIGEGLQAHQWSDEEMRSLAAEIAAVDLWKVWRKAISSERPFTNSLYDRLTHSSPSARASYLGGPIGIGSGASWNSTLILVLPRRLYLDNQLRHNLYVDELLTQVDESGFVALRDGPSSPEHLNGLITPHYYFLFRLTAPFYGYALHRYVRMQTQMEQARIVMAMERYRRARGTYPAALAELVPEWIAAIPADTGSHQPMIYRRSDDSNTFTLYGPGIDGKDDTRENGMEVEKKRRRDEIWRFSPAAAP